MTTWHRTGHPTRKTRKTTGRRAVAALGLACAMVVLTAAPGSAGSGGPVGAPDPYFPLAGNQGYDVEHYDLDLDFTPATDLLVARAAIKAEAHRDLTRFSLDFSGPAVERVDVDGRPAAYSRDGQELTVVPAAKIRAGRDFTVTVRYRGTAAPIEDPALGVYGWINTDDGAVALNEPDGARSWYPVNDDVRDKATYTFRITAPAGLTALANGEPQGRPRTVGDRTTATWSMRKPMSSYLSMIAIGRFTVTDGRVGRLPNITAYDPAGDGDDAALHRTTADAVRWGQERIGRYPFDSTGGIIDRIDVGYALETQARPVYDGEPDEATIVHEIAHQWFGNSVTPKTWADLWLNEGFASYAEMLWQEEHGGPTAQEVFDRLYATPAADDFWHLKTADPGRDDLFDYEAVYLRGAMALHALRTTIGDRDFFTLLKVWAEKYRYGSADTRDLMNLARRISGEDVKPLFDAWLYTAAKPPPPRR
ncbi:M1 family metallopeptidase [Yinghuangia sp. YIM S09857]|uniref:M1 family metallopeptidase n=1 Tax=Yinghuangia sp. YIM S09857 TaxID=3436929 RepID=UPI003F53775E